MKNALNFNQRNNKNVSDFFKPPLLFIRKIKKRRPRRKITKNALKKDHLF